MLTSSKGKLKVIVLFKAECFPSYLAAGSVSVGRKMLKTFEHVQAAFMVMCVIICLNDSVLVFMFFFVFCCCCVFSPPAKEYERFISTLSSVSELSACDFYISERPTPQLTVVSACVSAPGAGVFRERVQLPQ